MLRILEFSPIYKILPQPKNSRANVPKISEKKEELPKETLIENLKIKVRKLSDQDIKTRNLPNQTNGLVITSIEKNSPLAGSIEVNSIIVEAQKERIKSIDDLSLIHI